MALNPLAQIQVVTIAAMIVIFLVTLLLLRRVFFLPLIDVMERRAARIGGARRRGGRVGRERAARGAGHAATRQRRPESRQTGGHRREPQRYQARAEAEPFWRRAGRRPS
jgi:F0F1-type ATP synthase membrane subunit b/b'